MLFYHFSIDSASDSFPLVFDYDSHMERRNRVPFPNMPYLTSITDLLDSIYTVVKTKGTKYLMDTVGLGWTVLQSSHIPEWRRRTDFSFKTVFTFSDEQELDDFLQFVHKIFKAIYPESFKDFVKHEAVLQAHPIMNNCYLINPTHTVLFAN